MNIDKLSFDDLANRRYTNIEDYLNSLDGKSTNEILRLIAIEMAINMEKILLKVNKLEKEIEDLKKK